jgi:CheY-like chemotaxis protein
MATMQTEWLARVRYRRRTLVPKILVADDNSNIQKMVGLALKDQGIDVVAVGNGEAAVRKIADVRPDLVLADVFMPVRNGYEVCQFVKTDSALSHIPVILLVGAFDPLDEQEAQRVGADGVLKKPFIPPDPLISMVKSALQRSGMSHVSATATKVAEPEALRATDLLTHGSASVPAAVPAPIEEFHPIGGPAAGNESFVEEVPARPEPLRIDSGAQPVAFGSLLETPAAEEPEEDQSFVAPASPEFAMERDWRDRDEEETVEEAVDEEPAAWRPEGDAEEIPAAKTKKPKGSVTDWRTGGFEQIAAGKSRSMGWEPEEEKPQPMETAPAAVNRVTETPAAPPATAQETAPVAAKPFGTDAWAPVVPAAPTASNEKPSVETATAVEDKTPATNRPKPATEKKEGKDSWFSVSPSAWDAEILKANQLASTWDTPTAPNQAAAPTNGTEKAIADVSQETKAVIEEAALAPAAVEAIREEAAQVAEDATFIVEEPSSEKTSFYAHGEEANEAPETAPAAASNMDDLVAKVLAKMSPAMLQAVTREILKPVVEAMVKEELKSKKS